MPWFVLYTKSNSEKRVAEELRKRNIEVYCPLRRLERKWSDRIKIVEEPLFRSYCFVHLEEAQRGLVYGVTGIVAYLYWLKKPAIVRDEEIETIKKMLNDFDHTAIKVQQYAISDNVRIVSGAFMEREGQVISQQGNKLLLRLDSLGFSITVDISKTLVNKLVHSKRHWPE